MEYDTGNDPQRSFTADQQLCQIIPGGILQHICACPDDFSGRKDHPGN